MPLLVNLRHLERNDLALEGELPAADLDLELRDEMLRAEKPLRYAISVQKLNDNLLARGRLTLPLSCECVRCLKPFERDLDLPDWTCLVALSGAEAAPVTGDFADLTPYLREDILLELPQHPLCKPGCAGMKPPPPEKPKPGSPSRAEPSAWAELNKLKLTND